MISILRRLNVLGLAVASLGGMALRADAQLSFPNKPDRAHFYVDPASMIEASEGAEIDRIARALLQDEQVALIVATIPSLLDYNAGGFSIQQ